ncbi:HAMP domain-containing protein [Ideonella sp. B7]|uniref:sensor histidine kinase n=1 Tax=Ideonella benzenivorans TaxID=2831643 RepID=UPI001CED3A79|nr:ATP-binding protein [Ideonella benzenivorans]MCA6215422.1 HAMP domain-containing protein [Ideonella benzenivorans]
MKRSTLWAWVIGLLVVAGIGLVLTFVLSLVGQRALGYEQQFVWLFWVNVGVAALLVAVLLAAAVRLGVRLRQRKFGSKLLFKLAGIFALVGVLPGALIYTVSYQFVSRSVEAWFDTGVERALDAGLALGKGTLEALSADLVAKTRNAADRLAESADPEVLTLERLREQLGARQVALVSSAGQVLSTASTSTSLGLDRPPSALLRQAKLQQSASQIEGLEDDVASAEAAPQAQLRALARLPDTHFSLAQREDRYLMVVQPLPRALTSNALIVQAAYREYQQRHISRDGLRRMYIGTLTLSMVLSVLGAVVLAVLLGNQLARPLLLLAEGMRQVAAGDLGAKPVFTSRDEIGELTRSFADMTEQLGSARSQAERSMRQLDGARARLQTMLDSMTAGVIMFDRAQAIDTVNPGATRILRVPLSAYIGRPLGEVPGLADFATAIWQRFDQLENSPETGERDHWQESFELPGADSAVTLLVRGAMLPGQARLVVFDDITELVSAQRTEAWGEVARRLAHEIKNPLTPIQLSAERLQFKLSSKLEGADRAMLERSVATIVAQVQAMKQLVNEFRDYARLPAAKLLPTDLNALVAEVLALYGDQQEKGRLVARCAEPLPLVQGDATQLRQVIHNLVQNALDAVEAQEHARVLLETEVVRYEDSRAPTVRLKVSDNGPGFSEKLLKRAFEPYVTTKSKGTGLGLAVVKKIADEHGARVRIVNLSSEAGEAGAAGGAQVSLSFSGITEQKDPAGPPTANPPGTGT